MTIRMFVVEAATGVGCWGLSAGEDPRTQSPVPSPSKETTK